MYGLFSMLTKYCLFANDSPLTPVQTPECMHPQVMNEIQHIHHTVQTTRFSVLGVRNTPETVRKAYAAFLETEKIHALKALAVYHAHFIVAIRPEHDHKSRSEKTRAWYQAIAQRRGRDVFPDPADREYALQFDAYLEIEVTKLRELRDPEQKEYLEFKAKIAQEIENIRSIHNGFQQLQEAMQDISIMHPEKLKFLAKTIELMKRGLREEDVHLYAKDTINLLKLIESDFDQALSCHGKEVSRDLQVRVEPFVSHHVELMHSLAAKRKDIQNSAALKILALVVGTSIVQSDTVFLLRHTHIGHEVSKSVLNNGVSAVNNCVQVGIEQSASALDEKQSEDGEWLHNIMKVQPKNNLSDLYAGVKEEWNKNSKVLTLKGTAILTTMALGHFFPPVALVTSLCSGTFCLGKTAKTFYEEKEKLDQTEQEAESQKSDYEEALRDYLIQFYPPELWMEAYLERRQNLQSVNKMEEDQTTYSP